jgi:hypothetical protein
MLRVIWIGVSDMPIKLLERTHLLGWTSRNVNLTYLVYVPRGFTLRPAPGCEEALRLTYSRSKLHFPFDAVRLASTLHERSTFDLIVVDDPMGSGLSGYWLKRRFGLPLLIKCHSLYFGRTSWMFERVYHPFYHVLARFLLKRGDLIQAVSQCVWPKVCCRWGSPHPGSRCVPLPYRPSFSTRLPVPQTSPFGSTCSLWDDWFP